MVFGKAGGFSDIDVAAADFVSSGKGFRIFGADANDTAGRSVSSAGDINGDGFDDLIIGAPNADGSTNVKTSAGEAIVVFGGDFLSGVVFAGDNTDNTLTGTSADETFVGGQGNDTLVGGGGSDAFQGGEGDDVIIVADASFRKIDGGSGADTLGFTLSGGSLDFSVILPAKVDSIEAIDLSAAGSQSLALSMLDLFDLSDDTSGGITRPHRPWRCERQRRDARCGLEQCRHHHDRRRDLHHLPEGPGAAHRRQRYRGRGDSDCLAASDVR